MHRKKRYAAFALLAGCSATCTAGCTAEYDVLDRPDAAGPRDASVDASVDTGAMSNADAHPGADGGRPDAQRQDAGDPTRCDDLTCSGIPGNYCAAGICVMGTYSDIAFAEEHACIILRAPGPVHCLGANDRGQLGDGTTTSTRRFVRVAGITDATRVFVGRRHSCAITASGALRCWGANDVGQCGAAAGADALTPTTIDAAADELALGASHTCVRAGAVVHCFGGNSDGQLADGSTLDRSTLGAAIATDAAAIGAGEATTCVRATGGAVSCAGRNDVGQLDGVAGASRSTLTPVPIGEGVSSLAIGDAFGCAITTSGAVRCWGANDRGQLGIGTMAATPGIVSPALAPTAVMQISVGARHVITVDTSYDAQGWGDNAAAQIGFGGFTDATSPSPHHLPLSLPRDVYCGGTTVAASDSFGGYFFGGLADELRDP